MSGPTNGVNGVQPSTPPRSQPDSAASPQIAQQSTPSNTKKRPLPPSLQGQQQGELVNRALEWLSTATPGTLAGVAVGVAGVTYLIFRQVGLVLIGAVGGVALFASWEARNPEVGRAVRGEKGYDFLDRLFEAKKDASVVTRTDIDDDKDAQTLARSFDDFQPETRYALNSFVDAVVRDYVNWWYAPIVPTDRSFALACRKLLTSYILNISNRLKRKRPADAFVDFLTHSCSIIIVFFSEMANAYTELPLDSNMNAADAIYNYLASKPESPLSNLLNQKQQAAKFKMVADDLLTFLDKPAHDLDPARLFLREILATIVLEGTLQTCSKAEWINGWIVYLLESGETDLSQAIDEAIENQRAFGDVDGNVGNIGLAKGNRSSYDVRRKEMTHKKKLSKADEEMERAMEEMKRLNEMIAEADQAKSSKPAQQSEAEASDLLGDAMETNAKDLDLNTDSKPSAIIVSDQQETSRDGARGSSSSESARREEALHSPITTPRSSTNISSLNASPYQKLETPAGQPPYTSFDQFVPAAHEDSDDDARKIAPLTFHNAVITIHDDTSNDKGRLRAKPTWEYLLQIEPSSSQYPGWMAMKTYAQFEALHESLRRIAAISGSTAFLEAFSTFPTWKIHTRSSLRGEIERYMRTACAEKPVAESEAMKRFLEKSQDTRLGPNRGFSFESMSKGMLGAIQNAPKGAFDGGKTVMSGMTGVFGNIGIGPKKSPTAPLPEMQATESPSSMKGRPLSHASLPRVDTSSSMNGAKKSRDSLDSQRSSVISTQPGKMPVMERRPSYQADTDEGLHPARSDRWSVSAASSRAPSRGSSMAAKRSPLRSPSESSLSGIKLPPPPHEMQDDYESPGPRLSTDGNPRLLSPQTTLHSPSTKAVPGASQEKLQQTNGVAKRSQKKHVGMSEAETRVAVELLFAVINELYTLSSAWNIRRTFLAAAKSFLLRPGNPSLTSIQRLIQTSVLDANTTDEGIASQLLKLRENTMPTDEERAGWPAEMTDEEKEELRIKAKKLFIQSGVPATLMGIMGQSATNEALSRVFDCLQIEEIARGLFFGIILQAARVVTH